MEVDSPRANHRPPLGRASANRRRLPATRPNAAHGVWPPINPSVRAALGSGANITEDRRQSPPPAPDETHRLRPDIGSEPAVSSPTSVPFQPHNESRLPNQTNQSIRRNSSQSTNSSSKDQTKSKPNPSPSQTQASSIQSKPNQMKTPESHRPHN